ncbi:sugar phosphate isomerase/epimerase family protein [Cohnella sp. GCM10027633]|uniref:sugar phosphate isomerase/epimerase family protein n=1 Tax=unclassified Cohnella TaxID=2636738 RepID=UPI00363F615F
MKYAFTTFSCPDAGLDEVLRMARRYGYAGIEVRCGREQRHGIELSLAPEERSSVKHAIEANGIELVCIGVSCDFSNAETVRNHISETTAYLELARDLGVPYVRVFCGIIPLESSRAEARERIVGALKSLAPAAEEAGVIIAVETHDDWSDPQEMSAIMSAVDHPAVGVVWDVMHTLRTGRASMEEAYRALKPWLRHVHIHDGLLDESRLTFLPIGSGEIDHRAVVRILADQQYEGFLSGEWLDWEPADIHLPREIGAMRAYESERRN